MKSKVTDERIIQAKHKINSDAFSILLVVLLASVVVQQYILKAPVAQYIIEAMAVIGITIYVAIRSLFAINESVDEVKGGAKKLVSNALIVGGSITVLNGILNYMQYGDRYETIWLFIATLVTTFIFATLGAAILFIILKALSSYSQQRMEKKLKQSN